PEPLLPGVPDTVHPLPERLVHLVVRHRQVPGQEVEQGRDVGRTLDARLPAQRPDAAAGAAHVAQQELDDRAGADVLHAHAVLGPAARVHQRGGALPARVPGPGPAHLVEQLPGYAADLLHHLRGVAGVVPLEDLVHAVRALEGLVALDTPGYRRSVRLVPQRAGRLPLDVAVVVAGRLVLARVRPAALVVHPLVRVEAGEQ